MDKRSVRASLESYYPLLWDLLSTFFLDKAHVVIMPVIILLNNLPSNRMLFCLYIQMVRILYDKQVDILNLRIRKNVTKHFSLDDKSL